MNKIFRAVTVAASLTLAQSAAASDWAFDLKAAYALPVGNLTLVTPTMDTVPITNAWSGAIPLEVGARYRFTPNISGGAYFQWGPAFVANQVCNSSTPSVSCTGYTMRVGIEVVYGINPEGTINPWFSIGTGWEWSQFTMTPGGQAGAMTWNGWEYVNLQTGMDFNLTRAFAVGPYVGFFAGSYSNMTATGSASGGGGAVDVDARAFHGWFQFGVKGTLNL